MTLDIGIVSDTHSLLRPEVLAALQGVSLILHAGDVGGPGIVAKLETVAPVRVVRGNIDKGAWGGALPEEELVEAAPGCRILLRHRAYGNDADLAVHAPQIVVTGHTHVPRIERRGTILFINPGSAGPKRFSRPVCVVRLSIDGDRHEPKLVELMP